jgi:penicillin-binding protein 1A
VNTPGRMPDTPLRENISEHSHPSRGSRTSAAARHLLQSMRADLRALSAQARASLPTTGIARRVEPAGRIGRFCRRIAKCVAGLILVSALVLALMMLWVLRDLPLNFDSAEAHEREIMLEASNGNPLGRVGPLRISNASREEFPEQVVKAVLSVEDRRFYQHWGIDWLGIARASARNYFAGTIVEGGSSITQQLAKLRIVGRERTFNRKLREAFGAIWLEMRLSKDEILTRYLNSVYLGGGAQGLPAGAKLYFNKRLSDLTLSETALLAGLIKAPSRFNPLHNPSAAQNRANVVLDAMVENGAIPQRAADEAKARPAVLRTISVGGITARLVSPRPSPAPSTQRRCASRRTWDWTT